jgi:hypothetical protein
MQRVVASHHTSMRKAIIVLLVIAAPWALASSGSAAVSERSSTAPNATPKIVDVRNVGAYWKFAGVDTDALSRAGLWPDQKARFSIVYNYTISLDGKVSDLEVLAVNPKDTDLKFFMASTRALLYRAVDPKNPTSIRVIYATSAGGKNPKETVLWANEYANSLRRAAK